MFPSQVRTVIRTLSEQLVFLDGILKELAPSEARYEDVRKARETAAMELARRELELADLEKSKKIVSAKNGTARQAPSKEAVRTPAIAAESTGKEEMGTEQIPALSSRTETLQIKKPQWTTPEDEAKGLYDSLEETLRLSDDLTSLSNTDQYKLKQLRYLVADNKVPSTKKEGYQDLLNSFDKARKGAQSISNVASIRIPFNPWSTERLGMGQKISTSRTSKLGSAGDTFAVGDKTFEISSVSRKSLSEISHDYYLDEGAKSPEEFEQVWESLHPGGFKPGQIVYFHQFRELTPDVVELKKLLAKPELTQVESQKAVSLTQKVYKTEARNTLTPEENIALTKQVRKNLADSYTQLYSEGEVKAAKIAAYRKRQLEEEYTTLQE